MTWLCTNDTKVIALVCVWGQTAKGQVSHVAIIISLTNNTMLRLTLTLTLSAVRERNPFASLTLQFHSQGKSPRSSNLREAFGPHNDIKTYHMHTQFNTKHFFRKLSNKIKYTVISLAAIAFELLNLNREHYVAVISWLVHLHCSSERGHTHSHTPWRFGLIGQKAD